jgi:beta-lactamase regulating signal transducer with metallopeptidase domain
MESLQMISQIASTALISSIWQGAVLVAVIWLCLRLAPRTGANVRFNIWAAVFAATAVLPLLSLAIGRHDLARVGDSVTSSGSVILLDSRWALGIAAFWAVFAASRLFVLARNAVKVRALWRSSTPVELTPALQSILTQPRLRGAELCSSYKVDQPCVIGFFSPRILIPAWLLESATASELEQIVLHESAHLRRFDDWTNLVQKLALACFPLNPALLWIERRLCAEREVACDETVVRATNAPRDYATCLTHLAEQRMTRRTIALSGALSLGAWERRSQLTSRVESILLGKAKLGPMQARALAISLMLATVGGAVKLGSTAQLVLFASAQSNASLVGAGRNDINAGPHYQDVVFHPATAPAAGPLTGNGEIPTGSAKRAMARSAVKSSFHRTQHGRGVAGDGIDSLVIVTRWQSVSGQQMTVIDQVVRISALSAAQLNSGWFVVQL